MYEVTMYGDFVGFRREQDIVSYQATITVGHNDFPLVRTFRVETVITFFKDVRSLITLEVPSQGGTEAAPVMDIVSRTDQTVTGTEELSIEQRIIYVMISGFMEGVLKKQPFEDGKKFQNSGTWSFEDQVLYERVQDALVGLVVN